MKLVGQSVVRSDADAKVRGRSQYVDDLQVEGLWHGVVVRADEARGRLIDLKITSDFPASAVCVTAVDIPGKNVVDMMGHDMPFLVEDEIHYYGEPLALVAAPSRVEALQAAGCIVPTIEKKEPLLDFGNAVARFEAGGAVKELWQQSITRGCAQTGIAEGEILLERTYWTGYQEQLYIEPQGMIAEPTDDHGIYIHGSMQCPYYIQPELTTTLNMPADKIRVKQEMVGGAFGGKEEFPTLLAGYCALLAMKSRHPVKIVYDRHQDMLYTTKRHPAMIRYRVGLTTTGSLTGMHVDFYLDGGAYTTLSPVVLARGILHAALNYRCEHVYVNGRVLQTHTFPTGAFRGFGAPQAFWGLETLIDECADVCGIAPDEFRLNNALRKGDSTPTGQVLTTSVGSPDVIQYALDVSSFAQKYKRCSFGDKKASSWYGIGLSFFAHGAGFTGDGEARIKARAAVELDWDQDEPKVYVRVSSTEMGQGAHTTLAQVAADAIGVSMHYVSCPLPDTRFVPDSGPTVASRTAMVVGNIVHQASLQLRDRLMGYAMNAFFEGQPCRIERDMVLGADRAIEFRTIARSYLHMNGRLREEAVFTLSPEIRWNQDTFRGDAYPAYSWGCNVVELEVDRMTFQIDIKNIYGVFDVGRVLNPVIAKGQLEGGLTQALGYALYEKMNIKDGLYDASRMQTYIVPTMQDVPPMDLHFLEVPYEEAAPGAKGLGEIPMDGLAPAIGNAVYAATGMRITEIPITPEALFVAWMQRKDGNI